MSHREPPKLATVKEIAHLYRVTERTVYEWVRREALTVKRIGTGRCRRVRIVLDDRPTPSPES